MAKKDLEAIAGTEELIVNCHNAVCDKSYDLLKREEQVLGIPHPHTAAYYCSDQCWIEATSYEDAGIS